MKRQGIHSVDYYSEEIKTTLVEGLSQLGLSLETGVIDKAAAYFMLLLERNQSVNLISPKQDLRTQTVVHLVDSFSPLLVENIPRNISALDFGSGGGLPAIPLSMALTDWTYTLVEATGKKAAFLSFVKNELGLNNLTVINSFLDQGKNPENILYDLITARAVSDIAKLAAIAGPRLKLGGIFMAFKGPQGLIEIDDAAAELQKRRMRLIDQRDFVLPLVAAHRSLFIFEKF